MIRVSCFVLVDLFARLFLFRWVVLVCVCFVVELRLPVSFCWFLVLLLLDSV